MEWGKEESYVRGVFLLIKATEVYGLSLASPGLTEVC